MVCIIVPSFESLYWHAFEERQNTNRVLCWLTKTSSVKLEFLLKENQHAGGRSNDKRLQQFFCTWMYVVTDDIWFKIAPFFKRPGPRPECPDSELLAMALISECRGWDVETEMLSHWQEHRDLFPIIPAQSRFNRRRCGLMHAFNLIRRVVLQRLDVAQDRQCVINSLPLPMVQFHLVPSSPASSKNNCRVLHSVFSTLFGRRSKP